MAITLAAAAGFIGRGLGRLWGHRRRRAARRRAEAQRKMELITQAIHDSAENAHNKLIDTHNFIEDLTDHHHPDHTDNTDTKPMKQPKPMKEPKQHKIPEFHMEEIKDPYSGSRHSGHDNDIVSEMKKHLGNDLTKKMKEWGGSK